MTPERLAEIESTMFLDGAERLFDCIHELADEVRRLQAAQQEAWSDGFTAGEQSNEDVARMERRRCIDFIKLKGRGWGLMRSLKMTHYAEAAKALVKAMEAK